MSQTEGRLAQWAWAFVALLLASCLCFVPLFDLLGYELSLAVTPLCSAAALQLGLRQVARARARLPFSARELADLHPAATLVRLSARTAWRVAPIVLVPLVVSSLNALRVRNCNPGVGLLWYAVLPVGSALYAAVLGTTLGVFVPKLTSRWRALGTALGLLLVALAWCLGRLYFAPPIFVFDPLFGYFAGSVYDEHVGVPQALWWARAYHLALAAAFVSIAALWLDGHALAARRRATRRRRAGAFIAALGLVAALWGYQLGPRLGFRHDAATIATALGGERTTEHFVLHYRTDGPYAASIADVATELEFHFARLHALLGIAPANRVHAYLFASAAEKQALMGAGHTYIAKPWRNELYVNHEPFPQAVLGHELAHVFGAGAGDALLGIARRGLRLDVGLIEGLAEATTWHGGSLTSDEAVRVLELLGRRPSLDAVMSSRFWSLPSQQAYAISGSFCRFLLGKGEAAKLLALYRAGGDRAAYPAIYGESFAQLDAEWSAMIAKVPIEQATLERERDRILRPSIFRRPCARELARLVELARERASAGDHAAARALYAEVCADEPDDPGHLDEQLVEAARADDHAEVRAVAAQLLTHKKASAGQRGAAHAALGDLQARAGRYSAAAAEYAKAEREPSEEGISRLYTVERTLAERIGGADATPQRRAALILALSALSHASATAADDYTRLTRAAADAPEDALLAYLSARQLNGRAQWNEAEALLTRAIEGPLPDERFVRESARLRAEMSFRRRDFAIAAERFDALTVGGTAAMRADAKTWAERARFFGARSHERP